MHQKTKYPREIIICYSQEFEAGALKASRPGRICDQARKPQPLCKADSTGCSTDLSPVQASQRQRGLTGSGCYTGGQKQSSVLLVGCPATGQDAGGINSGPLLRLMVVASYMASWYKSERAFNHVPNCGSRSTPQREHMLLLAIADQRPFCSKLHGGLWHSLSPWCPLSTGQDCNRDGRPAELQTCDRPGAFSHLPRCTDKGT